MCIPVFKQMKFFIGLLVIFLALIGAGFYYYYTTGNTFGLDKTFLTHPTIDVSSTEFVNGAAIPQKFTCDDADTNPPFLFDRVTPDAKSLVFIAEDVDTKPVFTHWIIFNIDPKTINIDRPSDLTGASIGTNSFGKMEYDGPCPPKNSTHKYYFRLYALDTMLNLPEGAKRSEIDAAIKGHKLGWGEMFGTYSR